MEKSRDGNGENKSNTKLQNKQYNLIKWTNQSRGEISLRENWYPLKKHEEKIKTWMGNATGNADRKNYESRPKW